MHNRNLETPLGGRREDSGSPLLPMEEGLADLRRRMDEADSRSRRAPIPAARLLTLGALLTMVLAVGLMIWWLAGK